MSDASGCERRERNATPIRFLDADMLAQLESIGDYRLLDVLGRGGMGVVYRARHRETGAVVALKTVGVHRVRDLQSIRREIVGLSRLRHPGIVRILEEGVSEGIPWYAMELLHGRPLRHWMTDGSAPASQSVTPDVGLRAQAWWSESLATDTWSSDLAGRAATVEAPVGGYQRQTPDAFRSALSLHGLEAVLRLVQQLCAPLAFLHNQGMVHRDIKPENILLTATSREMPPATEEQDSGQAAALLSRGSPGAASGTDEGDEAASLEALGSRAADPAWPVIVDFGLHSSFGTSSGRDELAIEATGAGTVQYMAPEQIQGSVIDARADLYSMGCLLYELVCGRAPFVGRSAADVLSSQLTRQPTPPSDLVPGLDARLSELILILLSKRPRDRIGHSVTLAARLAELGAVHRPSARPGRTDISAEASANHRPSTGSARTVVSTEVNASFDGLSRPHLFRPALIGRSADSERLLGAIPLDAAAGGLVLVGGESGVGKTRLLTELIRALPPKQAQILTGDCRESGSEPLHTLRMPLQTLSDWCRERGIEWSRQILGASASTLALYEPALERFAESAAPAGQRDRHVTPLQLYTQLCRALRRLTKEAPVVLLLDDLQWADGLSLGWLHHLLEFGWLERMRLFVVGTYRTEERGDELQRLLAKPEVTRIELGRLEARDVEALISEVLSLRPVPTPLTRLLVRVTEGNPLFVAEYLRAVVDHGLLSLDHRGRWVGALLSPDQGPTGLVLPFPQSLRGLIERRLDGLDAPARSVVTAAALVGQDADRQLLARVAGVDEAPGETAVDLLVRREILVDAHGVLRFAHDKLREVAQEGLSQIERTAMHRVAAETLEERKKQGSEVSLAELARHWELAGRPDRALEWYLPAARHAAGRAALEDAERLYRSHLRLLDGISEHSIEVRNELASRLFHLQGRMERGRAEHSQALAESRQISNRRAEARSLRLLGVIQYHTGGMEETEALYDQALSAALELGDVWLESATRCNMASLLNLRGRLDEAVIQAQMAVALDKLHHHEDLLPTSLGTLAMIWSNQGRPADSEKLYGEVIELLRAKGDRDAEGTMLSNLGNLHRMHGALDRARSLHERALEIQRERGNLRDEARILGNLGEVEREAGRLSLADALCRQARSMHQQTGNRRSAAFLLDILALVQLQRGDIDGAKTLLLQALDERRSMKSGLLQVSTLLDLADVARQTGPDLDEAARFVDEVRVLLDESGHQGLLHAHWSCRAGHLDLAVGRSAAPRLEELRGLEAQARFTFTISLRQNVDALSRAQAAFELGEDGLAQLYRGQLLSDVPEAVRRWLVQQGRVTAEQAGLPAESPPASESIPLELGWD